MTWDEIMNPRPHVLYGREYAEIQASIRYNDECRGRRWRGRRRCIERLRTIERHYRRDRTPHPAARG